MHLKNFSLIEKAGVVELSPAYDLLNTSIVLNGKEEIALPLRGKKSRLNRSDFFDYYGKERLSLNDSVLKKIEGDFLTRVQSFNELIGKSFLSEETQDRYRAFFLERMNRLSSQ